MSAARRGGSSFDAELAIPEATTFGVVASYNYRHLAGAWEIDAQAFQLDGSFTPWFNVFVEAGLSTNFSVF